MLTPTDQPIARYWAVTGRCHGSDEDTGLAYTEPMTSWGEAVEAFRVDLREGRTWYEVLLDRGYEPEEITDKLAEEPDDGEDAIYISAVFSSLTPITLH
jgi:hypothetical protein